MIWVDYFLLAIITISALLSLWRGFVREALSLASWIVALWVAILFFERLGGWLARWIDTPSISDVVAFTVLFVSTVVLGGLVNLLAGQLVAAAITISLIGFMEAIAIAKAMGMPRQRIDALAMAALLANIGKLFIPSSVLTTTEPLTDEQVASVNPHDLAICDPNFVLQYYRLSADKRFLFGARINTFSDDPGYIKRHHLPLLLRLYPQLHGIRVDYAWGGTIGVPLHRVPRIGRVAPNVFYSQGYSGHGVNVTHLAGEIMADAVTGTLERFDIFAGIKSTRFPGSHMLRKPLVTLGVLYPQIRDRL